MPEISTSSLVEGIDSAIRDAYQAIRTALHKVEDLKMEIIRQPAANPFGSEHDEMYQMYLDLSRRFQATREEIRERSNLVQPPPPTPTPEPAPRAEQPPALKTPIKRDKHLQAYVLVPVSFVGFLSVHQI